MPTESQAFVSEWKGKTLDGIRTPNISNIISEILSIYRARRASEGRHNTARAPIHAR